MADSARDVRSVSTVVSRRDAVQQAFDCFGREAGFEKKSGSWYRHAEEVIAVSNIQKSQYGPSYYINQGYWLRRLGNERYPKIVRCHVQARLEDLLPEAEHRIVELLNVENEMPDRERVDELVLLLKGELLPLIEQGSSVTGLRAMLAGGLLAGAGITGPAQPLLAPDGV